MTDTPQKSPITFDDIAKHPQGLTPLADTAKLFTRNAETLRRWVRAKTFITPVNINGFYYFRNSDLLEYVERQQSA